jgi:PAS domain S-box-containing protein
MHKYKFNIKLLTTLVVVSVIFTIIGIYLLMINVATDEVATMSKSIPQANAVNEYLQSFFSNFLYLSILFFLLSFVGVFLLVNYIFKPLTYLNEVLGLIQNGILPQKIESFGNDEVGEISNKISSLVKNMKLSAQFAQAIGVGSYHIEYQTLGAEDVLGNALLNMRNSLQQADIKENDSNWIAEGKAKLSDILRNNNKIEELGEQVLNLTIPYISAIQGAFYVVNEGDEEQRTTIEMVSWVAYNRKKYQKKSFFLGEGLVGQSVAEQDFVIRTEIPRDYETVSSGILGHQKPTCIFIYPLIANEKVFGALEFAGFELFSETQQNFIKEIGPMIARTIFNIQVAETTQKHLEESQRMSNELRIQQEELRQNAEEMQATQEELQITNKKLEEQISEVSKTQKRMHSLLENASEVITIYEKDGKIKYVSPSVKRILDYSYEELIGTKDDIHIHEDNIEQFHDIIRKLLVHPDKSFSFQYQYLKNNGEWIWLEATGKNLLDDAAVKGIVFNARDITLKRKAEIEERMRKNMQALSENSLDLITRLSNDGEVAYVNPTIETYTEYKPIDFINQKLDSLNIGNGIVKSWIEILNQIKQEQKHMKLEMNYHAPMGDRVMQVNAIPEFNEETLESVLVVAHDITERKKTELEIQLKNKNINESINYSRRIQNAIIPDSKELQKTFDESFIMYKPRDVVSGDFPWFCIKNDIVFVAVVDCTGHGVPGAMLSLVGYFQLNNIVDAYPNFNSAQILDKLDQQVNSTLIKDSSEENIKDGMDVAFCKYDKKSNILEYAGAHRQLYHFRKQEFMEYKGDKWAIGGGIYKNQTHFSNHKINIKKGDSVFFFSDGLTDQFGGADNRKFASTRVKQILSDNIHKPMQEIHKAMQHEFEAWQGNHKQTDDVLLIGLRF